MYNINNMQKVLIIEDENLTQQIYKDALTTEGFAVVQAFSGKQGLTMAKSEQPSIIILDVMLPFGMNGFDVLEELKKDLNLRDIPVLMFTNLDSEEKTALSIGASDYIIKANTSISEVIKKIKKHIKTP